ncbi:multiple RNA-binding domain-containing protein [Vairimorpha necatrix]|uniref:Multiple RNA-binding domain-containing protein n=1 Tax=Vairimorpha necatrix TaxID=6039 RepID=A0AAX4J9F2_9MICR
MRLIVKNLPKFLTENEIKKEFSTHGKIVDFLMLKDSKGNFRRVCYISYQSTEISNKVIKKMNNSYISNHKISVEEATPIKKEISESEERIVKYHNKIIIKGATLEDIPELKKFGDILKYEINDNNIILQYRDVENTLRVLKEVSILNGKFVKISPYKNTPPNTSYYNSLFFNFESVIKNTCDLGLKKNELVDLDDDELGTKVALLETNLVNETDKFLKKNSIFLDKISDKKNKKVLIVRNVEINKILNFVKCKCKIEPSPSRNLVLLKFKNEDEAQKCFKNINLRRCENEVIYCEYAPLCEEQEEEEEAVEKDDKKIKMLIKNIPFQATEKDIRNLFKNKYKIQGIRLPIKRDGTLRGFAFVTFDTRKSLDEAIEYFGKSTHLYGRRLVLEIANE